MDIKIMCFEFVPDEETIYIQIFAALVNMEYNEWTRIITPLTIDEIEDSLEQGIEVLRIKDKIKIKRISNNEMIISSKGNNAVVIIVSIDRNYAEGYISNTITQYTAFTERFNDGKQKNFKTWYIHNVNGFLTENEFHIIQATVDDDIVLRIIQNHIGGIDL